MNLWGFLSIGVVFGASLVMLVIYLDNKKQMKRLELEALQYKSEKPQYE